MFSAVLTESFRCWFRTCEGEASAPSVTAAPFYPSSGNFFPRHFHPVLHSSAEIQLTGGEFFDKVMTLF